MGFPPPPDAPDPSIQDAANLSASMPAAPTGPAGICGFALPQIPGFPSFTLPPFPPKFDFPPAIPFALPPLCDLAKPIAESAGYGGGRVGRDDLEKDAEFG